MSNLRLNSCQSSKLDLKSPTIPESDDGGLTGSPLVSRV